MIAHSNKAAPAESARINGAKSKGAEKAEGTSRSQTASQKHGLHAVRGCLLPGETLGEYAQLQAKIHVYWQPKGCYDRHLVEELAGNLWEAERLQASKNDNLHDALANTTGNSPYCKGQAKLNLEAGGKVTVAGGGMDGFNARATQFTRERHRLEKRCCTSGSSQMSLKINNRQHSDLPATADAKPVGRRQSEASYVVEATAEPLPEIINTPVNNHDPELEDQPTTIDWVAVRGLY